MHDDRGSTIPLILGFVLLALIMVAGSVALGDAFVQQESLQNVCDGAASAAASSVDSDAQRAARPGTGYLQLTAVQASVQRYLEREPNRADVAVTAGIDAGGTVVTVHCERRSRIAFGRCFGNGAGVDHRATSAARSPESG